MQKSTEILKMKSSTKLLLSGLLTVITIVVVGEIFDGLGVMYGPAQAGMTGFAGLIASLRLFSGS